MTREAAIRDSIRKEASKLRDGSGLFEIRTEAVLNDFHTVYKVLVDLDLTGVCCVGINPIEEPVGFHEILVTNSSNAPSPRLHPVVRAVEDVGDEYVEKVRNQIYYLREYASNAIRWHTVHLDSIENQMDPKYDPDIEQDEEQDRLVREAYLDYIFLDRLKCVVDHVNEMSSDLNENRGEDS